MCLLEYTGNETNAMAGIAPLKAHLVKTTYNDNPQRRGMVADISKKGGRYHVITHVVAILTDTIESSCKET